MRKTLFQAMLAAAVCVITYSCSNDNGSAPGVYVSEGDPILFSATTEGSALLRTSYGELDGDKYPVYWENGDQVKIYCPQAQETTEAAFTISGVTENTSIYSLSNNAEGEMRWGAQDTHHFYMFYPAQNVQSCENGVITATVPREQHVTVDENNVGCNMDYALMAGHTSYNRSATTDNTVLNLPFVPITTNLDIEIKAPDGLSMIVNTITIANPEGVTANRSALSGTFTFDINYTNIDNEYWEQKSVTDGSAVVRVVLDNPVTLTGSTDQTLKVSAFLLPGAPSNLRVIVNGQYDVTQGSTITRSKTFNNVPARKKTVLKMGKLPSYNEDNSTYETWMASISDNVYISQLSLPGTHDAGAYVSGSLGNNIAQTQTLNIQSQLNAGVRVLDFRPEYNGTDFDVAHGAITLDGVTFDGILTDAVTWLANHPTEFIIVQLKNESDGSASDESSMFRGWQKQIREKMIAVNSDYTIEDFNPSMTMKDVRGKLLFMCRDDYDGDWFGCKVSGWPDNESDWQRKFYTKSYTEGIGIVNVSDLYGRGSTLQPNKSDKQSAISNMLNKAKADNTVDTWYMTWLNVRGEASIWNPGRRNGDYNQYAADIINDFSKSATYEKSGIVVLDWAGYASYNGDDIIKAVIDNNFRAGGPKCKAE